jgi:predicted Zn-dependent protease
MVATMKLRDIRWVGLVILLSLTACVPPVGSIIDEPAATRPQPLVKTSPPARANSLPQWKVDDQTHIQTTTPQKSDQSLVTGAPESRAVTALLQTAQTQLKADNLDAASSSLERASRLEPRNARLWYQLARVRLKQGRAQEAESLARKSLSLAGHEVWLQQANWELIAQARASLGDEAGAETARLRSSE